MEFSVKIMLNNAAYSGNSLAPELCANLDQVILKIAHGARNGAIFDTNGNKTGFFEINHTGE